MRAPRFAGVRFRNEVFDFERFRRYIARYQPDEKQCMKSRATILIVDDDPDVLTAARLLLRQYFEKILTATNPEQVTAMMDDQSIGVFLVDMNFAIGRSSGAEGLHCLAQIRSKDPDAVVVLMTAFGDLNTAVQGMREGAVDFVLKPWQNENLVATLSVAAELWRNRDARAPAEVRHADDESLNLEANERRLIVLALERADGNISHAAEALGITRASLYRRIRKFDL